MNPLKKGRKRQSGPRGSADIIKKRAYSLPPYYKKDQVRERLAEGDIRERQ